MRHAVAQQRRAEAVRERSLMEESQRLDFMQFKQERHAEQLERAAAEKAAAEVGWAWCVECTPWLGDMAACRVVCVRQGLPVAAC